MDLGKVFTKKYEEFEKASIQSLVSRYVNAIQLRDGYDADTYFLSKLALLEKLNYNIAEFNSLVIKEKERRYNWEIECVKSDCDCYKDVSTEELGRIVRYWGPVDSPGDYAALGRAERALEMRLEPLGIHKELFLSDL